MYEIEFEFVEYDGTYISVTDMNGNLHHIRADIDEKLLRYAQLGGAECGDKLFINFEESYCEEYILENGVFIEK